MFLKSLTVKLNAVFPGEWTDWTPWSRCSRSCGDGEESRYRTCTGPAPGVGGMPCRGRPEERRPCNKKDCTGEFYVVY